MDKREMAFIHTGFDGRTEFRILHIRNGKIRACYSNESTGVHWEQGSVLVIGIDACTRRPGIPQRPVALQTQMSGEHTGRVMLLVAWR